MPAFFKLMSCALVAAVPLHAGTATAAQPLRPVTIALSSPSIPAGAARIAKEMGLFEKQGLQATLKVMDTGAVASAALMGGSVDFVTTGPSDVINAQMQGRNLVVLTSAYRGFAATLVISKAAAEKAHVSETAPVAARLKALDGLTIATTSSSSTFGVGPRTAAEGAGAKVHFTYMSQPTMMAALHRGIIDGYVSSAPFYLLPVVDGTAVVWINGPKGEWPAASSVVNSVVVIATREFAQANPVVVKQMRAVFSDFWRNVAEHPAEVKAAMAKVWPDVDAKTLDLIYESERLGFKAAPVTADDMAHEIAFMKLGNSNPKTDQIRPADMLLP